MLRCPRAACFAKTRKPLLWILLDFGYPVAVEPDENSFRRRLSIDPIFDVVAFGVPFPHFVVGLANRRYHFFAIHAYNRPAFFYRLFHFGWQRIHPLNGGGALPPEIEERREKLFQVIQAQIRNGLAEIQIDRAASARLQPRRTRLLLLGGRLDRRNAAHFDMEAVAQALLTAPATI